MFDPDKTTTLPRHRLSRIGLLLMLPLVLVNCTCGVALHELATGNLTCKPKTCSLEDLSCDIVVEYATGDGVTEESVIFKPNTNRFSTDGHDGHTSRERIVIGGEVITIFLYDINQNSHNDIFSFNPSQATDGKFNYAFELRSPSSGKNRLCAGIIPIQKYSLKVALRSSNGAAASITLEPGVPALLPGYIVSGRHTTPLTPKWSSATPEMVFGFDGLSQKSTIMLPLGFSSDAVFMGSALLTVASQEPDGSSKSGRVLLRVDLSTETLSHSPASPLSGDTVTLEYSDSAASAGGVIESWLLEVSFLAGSRDESDWLVDSGNPNIRTFTALRPGFYYVEAKSSTGRVFRRSFTVEAPTVHIAFSPAEADIDKGDTVTFDASGSTLPPGSQITWELVAAPADSKAELVQSTENQELATLTPDTLAGSYQVRISLKLPQQAQALSTTSTINFVSAPVAAAVTDRLNFDVGDLMDFDLGASVYPANSTFEYRYAVDGGDFQLLENDNGRTSLPAAVEGEYVIELTITNSEGESATFSTTVTVAPVIIIAQAPEFSAPTAAVGIAENQAVTGYIAVATDPNGDELSYTITGGADQHLFDLNEGALAFKAATDFEDPGDSNQDNDYEVEVTVTDKSPNALTATQIVRITVNNLADDDAVALPVNSDFPVIDDDGGLDEAIVVDIGADDSLSVRVIPDSLVSEATALAMLGNQDTAGTVTLIDTREDGDSDGVPEEDPWLLHSVAWGAVLDLTDQHKVVLLRDGEVYYQLTLSFDSEVTAEGNLTVKEVSGYNCGTSEANCP